MSLREKMAAEIAKAVPWPLPMSREDCLPIADAALRALRPVDAVQDLDPVVLYFPDETARADFIEVVMETCPGLRAVPVP